MKLRDLNGMTSQVNQIKNHLGLLIVIGIYIMNYQKKKQVEHLQIKNNHQQLLTKKIQIQI